MSKIRAHFDGAGNPVAVTNTMDEPNGLSDVRSNGLADAIGRERKGIGMHSEGFVPNFRRRGSAGKGSKIAMLRGAFGGFGKMTGQIKASRANIKTLKANTAKLKKENKAIEKKIKSGKLNEKELAANKEKLSQNNDQLSQHTQELQGNKMMQGVAMFTGGQMALGQLQNNKETIDNFVGGKARSSVTDFASNASSMALTGAMVAGPIGAGVGAVVGAISSATSIIVTAMNKKKEAEERLEKGRDMRKRLAKGVEYAGGGKKIRSTIESLAESGESANEFSQKLAEQREKLISLAGDKDSTEFDKEVEKLAKMMKVAQTQIATFQELDRLAIESKALAKALKKQRTIVNIASEARVESAQDAVDKLGFMSKIRTPELTGERKKLVDRSLRGQSAIAGALTGRETLSKLKIQLSQETDKDKKEEIGEKIKQATKVFENSVVSASISLKNNLKEAEFDLGKLKKTLTTQQEKTFDSRLDLAGNLKGETVTADIVRDNVKKLREAGDDAEKILLAVQRLNENKTQLDALNPAIFKGILDAMGMSGKEQEELTRKSDELSLRGTGITDQKTIDAIIERLKQDRPDIKTTQNEIKILETSIKGAKEQIDIFKEAFNPASIKTNVATISTALENFAKGMGDGTLILNEINDVNLSAALQIARSNTIVKRAEKMTDATEKRLDVIEARQTTLEKKLGD